MPTPDLLPCPFCGSTNLTATGWITCLDCLAMGPSKGAATVAGAWNRRISPLATEIVAGLEAFADHLDAGGTVADWPGTHTRTIDDETS